MLIAELRADLDLIPTMRPDDPSIGSWRMKAAITLRNVFGERSDVYESFSSVHFWADSLEPREFVEIMLGGVVDAEHVLKMADLELTFWPDDSPTAPTSSSAEPIVVALNICERFHLAERMLRERGRDRSPLLVEDEHDMQYLMGALLSIEFSDIIPEDYVPAYAGATSRIDFVLRPERIAIETKMTRKDLRDKKVGEELIVDIKRYEARQDIDTLICLVHDPDHLVKNPRGLETDLEKHAGRLKVRVLVRPT